MTSEPLELHDDPRIEQFGPTLESRFVPTISHTLPSLAVVTSSALSIVNVFSSQTGFVQSVFEFPIVPSTTASSPPCACSPLSMFIW